MDHRQEDQFEYELKSALHRQEPPNGFTVRVLARLEQARPEPWRQPWLRLPSLRWALACALGIAVFAGGWMFQQERRRAEGEAARQQVMLALRITGAKMQLAEARVRHLSER